MNLQDLGYSDQLEQARLEHNLKDYEMGRVVAEHKERYIVKTAKGDVEAEITGNLRFSAVSRENFPAVGDWVALINYDPDFAIIHKILPRYSILARHSAGQSGEIQVIAANIDYAFLVQAVDRDFNINRLERYLTICNAAKVDPLIVLTKIDLVEETRLADIRMAIRSRVRTIPVLAISNTTLAGYEEVKHSIVKRKTYCILGSSGAGKSTLINNLSGKTIMQTAPVSQSTNKGRHTTSHRELIILEDGGILIDNPGMREVGIADTTNGLEITFDKIFEYARVCKFKDCRHISEAGCAVLKALKKGAIDRASYENYLKMEKEKAFFESTVAERRKKEKLFGKMMKNYKKDIKRNN